MRRPRFPARLRSALGPDARQGLVALVAQLARPASSPAPSSGRSPAPSSATPACSCWSRRHRPAGQHLRRLRQPDLAPRSTPARSACRPGATRCSARTCWPPAILTARHLAARWPSSPRRSPSASGSRTRSRSLDLADRSRSSAACSARSSCSAATARPRRRRGPLRLGPRQRERPAGVDARRRAHPAGAVAGHRAARLRRRLAVARRRAGRRRRSPLWCGACGRRCPSCAASCGSRCRCSSPPARCQRHGRHHPREALRRPSTPSPPCSCSCRRSCQSPAPSAGSSPAGCPASSSSASSSPSRAPAGRPGADIGVRRSCWPCPCTLFNGVGAHVVGRAARPAQPRAAATMVGRRPARRRWSPWPSSWSSPTTARSSPSAPASTPTPTASRSSARSVDFVGAFTLVVTIVALGHRADVPWEDDHLMDDRPRNLRTMLVGGEGHLRADGRPGLRRAVLRRPRHGRGGRRARGAR